MSVNKREAKILQPALIFNWEIDRHPTNESIGWWDGDGSMPVKIGPVIKSLIDKGYLDDEKCQFTISATSKARELLCHCYKPENAIKYSRLCPDCIDGVKFKQAQSEGE